MAKKFIKQADRHPEQLDWGQLTWISNKLVTNADQLVVIEVHLEPGKGHDFHKHPGQEEVIYVIKGEVEQWVDQEKSMLTAGESAFIPADMVHASFNIGSKPATLLAILSPCMGDQGYELVEVFEDEPWNGLR